MRLSALLLVVGLATISTTAAAPGPRLPERSEVPAVSNPPEPLPPSVDTPVEEAKFGTTRLFFPDECPDTEEGFNLVVHFHGAPPVVKRELAESGLNAAVMVKNVGILSKPYRDRYSYAWTLDALTRQAARLVAEQCQIEFSYVRRLALSAWSAGFAAVAGILRHSESAGRVEAVLLADGLHAAFVNRHRREFAPQALEVFTSFAEGALEGERLMVITHSQIATREYASTTESADYLLKHLGLTRDAPPAGMAPERMDLLSQASSGAFTLQEYAGTDARAHGQHLHSMGHLLFVPLRDFWSMVPEEGEGFGTAHDPVTVRVDVHDDMYCTRSPSAVDCRTTAE